MCVEGMRTSTGIGFGPRTRGPVPTIPPPPCANTQDARPTAVRRTRTSPHLLNRMEENPPKFHRAIDEPPQDDPRALVERLAKRIGQLLVPHDVIGERFRV